MTPFRRNFQFYALFAATVLAWIGVAAQQTTTILILAIIVSVTFALAAYRKVAG